MEENVNPVMTKTNLDLNEGSVTHLIEIRKLALFIGIVMLALFVMICIAMLVLMITGVVQKGLFIGTITLLAGVSLLLASAIYLLAFIYLSRISTRMREAFDGGDSNKLEMAFLNMKYFFRLMAIVLTIYIIGFIIFLATKAIF